MPRREQVIVPRDVSMSAVNVSVRVDQNARVVEEQRGVAAVEELHSSAARRARRLAEAWCHAAAPKLATRTPIEPSYLALRLIVRLSHDSARPDSISEEDGIEDESPRVRFAQR